MLIVDGHLDLSMNALQWNRDLLASVYTIRAQEAHTPGKGRGQNTVALPEMRRGRISLAFATLIARSTGRPVPHIDYPTAVQACGMAKGQLAYYRALERSGQIRVIEDAGRLGQHVEAWIAWERRAREDEAPPPLGFVISMEGADPILSPDQLEEWWRDGLRLLGLTHYGPGRYAGGTGTESGLTDLGRALLREMSRVGMALDVTHCSDRAFAEALDLYSGPVLASHSNARALVPHQRQFSDAQLRTLFARHAVVGVALDCWMIAAGWRHGDSNERVLLRDVISHIDRLCELAGDCRHVGIGSDLDGGFGREGSPHDLDTIADLQAIAELLGKHGYAPADIEAVMHGNWINFLRKIWTVSAVDEAASNSDRSNVTTAGAGVRASIPPGGGVR